MAKYNVPLDICVHSYQEIEADSVEEALKKATDNIYALGFDKVITNNGFYVFQDMDDCIEEIEDEKYGKAKNENIKTQGLRKDIEL